MITKEISTCRVIRKEVVEAHAGRFTRILREHRWRLSCEIVLWPRKRQRFLNVISAYQQDDETEGGNEMFSGLRHQHAALEQRVVACP